MPSVSLLLDENVPYGTISLLEERFPGLSVLHAADVGLTHRADETILEWCQSHFCALATYDKDFSDIRTLARQPHHGIIRLRLEPTTAEVSADGIAAVLNERTLEELDFHLVIVRTSNVAIMDCRTLL